MNSELQTLDTHALDFIHLLYAPTNFCNMGCQYCYLGEGTNELTRKEHTVSTLRYALDKFLEANTIPFNLSLHGGEPTAIPKQHLKELLQIIKSHYQRFGADIKKQGFPLNPIHIKTNLYNFHDLYELFDEYQVSVSASIDLPLSLHEKYRTDKKGESTLNRIKSNLKLLAQYPHKKKTSCVITQEHIHHIDDIIADIKTIHYDWGMDMSRFNVMFAFDSEENTAKFNGKVVGTEMPTEEQHVYFYNALKEAFQGTELEQGFKEHWFKEFTPDYCCSAVNCGNKFFLLQSNGDVYACPRGQSSKRFLYGNVFRDQIQQIRSNGWQTIEQIENALDSSEDCYRCEYLPYCHQGCVFVREQTKLTKSYTCQLQKAIYQDDPIKYPPFRDDYIKNYSRAYRFQNNLKSFEVTTLENEKKQVISDELYAEDNTLSSLIKRDEVLSYLYSEQVCSLTIDGVSFSAKSPIIYNTHDVASINANSEVRLNIDKQWFQINCPEPVNNSLQLMFLRNTLVTYGDERRQKQEHLADYHVYYQSFLAKAQEEDNHWRYDISVLFKLHQHLFLPNVRNNVFFTSKAIRDYHYAKQKRNAFYHIQAINLPFPFLEFYWHDLNSQTY